MEHVVQQDRRRCHLHRIMYFHPVSQGLHSSELPKFQDPHHRWVVARIILNGKENCTKSRINRIITSCLNLFNGIISLSIIVEKFYCKTKIIMNHKFNLY